MSPFQGHPSTLVAWALLSQAIWLPLLGIDLHDRFLARVNQLSPPGSEASGSPRKPADNLLGPVPDPVKESLAAALRQPSTGYVLGARSDLPESPLLAPFTGSVDDREASASPGLGIRPRPLAAETLQALRLERSRPAGIPQRTSGSRPRPVGLSFRRSDLLGGPLGLSDIDAPAMPPLALAERARLSTTTDPLAPLPRSWRTPMRKALRSLPRPAASVTPARVIHVPSTRVTRPTPVPLALQSDGTVDILSRPEDPAVLREIEVWSSRQTPPQAGSVTPAVVNLQPLEKAPSTVGVRRPPQVPIRQSAPTVSSPSPQAVIPRPEPRSTPPSSEVSPPPPRPVQPVGSASASSIQPSITGDTQSMPQSAPPSEAPVSIPSSSDPES